MLINVTDKMNITAIVAANAAGAIGVAGGIPWRLRSDMQFFRATTTGGVVIMGRKTFDSLGRNPLPKRTNIVLSGSTAPAPDGAYLQAQNVEEALALAWEAVEHKPHAHESAFTQTTHTIATDAVSAAVHTHTPSRTAPQDTPTPQLQPQDGGIFIIGGGEIYRLFMPHTQRVLLTLVDKPIGQADASFDFAPLESADWERKLLKIALANPPHDACDYSLWEFTRRA
jgi:dihydrofolate reductase